MRLGHLRIARGEHRATHGVTFDTAHLINASSTGAHWLRACVKSAAESWIRSTSASSAGLADRNFSIAASVPPPRQIRLSQPEHDHRRRRQSKHGCQTIVQRRRRLQLQCQHQAAHGVARHRVEMLARGRRQFQIRKRRCARDYRGWTRLIDPHAKCGDGPARAIVARRRGLLPFDLGKTPNELFDDEGFGLRREPRGLSRRNSVGGNHKRQKDRDEDHWLVVPRFFCASTIAATSASSFFAS